MKGDGILGAPPRRQRAFLRFSVLQLAHLPPEIRDVEGAKLLDHL